MSVTAPAAFAAPGTLQFSAASYSIPEDAGVATITVLRTRGSGPVTVHYATSDGTATAGTDYTLSAGTLTFGARETRKTFTVPLTNDALVNGLRTVHLTLSAPTGGAVLGAHSTAVLTILDDDRGGVVQFGAPTYSVSEGAGTATLTVVRTEGRAGGVTVAYATSNGTATAGADYTATSGTLTFAAGGSRHTVTIPIATDALIEGDETVRVTLSSPGGGAVLGGQRTAVLTIVDDDAAVQFSQPRYRVGETGGGATVTVERVGGTAGTVTVPYATSPGTALADLHYTAVAGTLTFAAGVKSRTFTVPVLADGQVTADKTVTLTLGAPTGASLGTLSTAMLTIVNTDSRSGPVLTGTAAAGAPLASRLIRIKDKLGAKRTGIIDSQGKYTFSVSGLTAPYLLKVEPPNTPVVARSSPPLFLVNRFGSSRSAIGPPKATPVSFVPRYATPKTAARPFKATPIQFTLPDPDTTPLFSVGTQEGVVNITPFTDLIIRTWYEVQGTTIDAAFADPVNHPAPTVDQVTVIASLVVDMLNIFLKANGLDPATFDLFSTSFDADHTGFDAVLDASGFAIDQNTGNLIVTLTNQPTDVTQTTALTIVNNLLKGSTTGQIGNQPPLSASITSAVVPTDPAVQAALAGVLQALSNEFAVINTKGAALTADDLQPFFDANFLDRGADPSLGAKLEATNRRGQTINSFRADSIVSYDDPNKVVCITGTISETVNGVIIEEVFFRINGKGICFRQQNDGSWRYFGDQQIALVAVSPLVEQSFCPPGLCLNLATYLRVQLVAPQGTVSSWSASGSDGSMFSIPTPDPGDLVVAPTPTTTLVWKRDSFSKKFPVASFPPPDTVYTFTITPFLNPPGPGPTGPPVSYTAILGASTSEAISFTNLTSHDLAAANLGQPLTLQWTLPTTFPYKFLDLFGYVYVANFLFPCIVPGTGESTSGTITLPTTPTTCKGVSEGIGKVIIAVTFYGLHGEQTRALWYFR